MHFLDIFLHSKTARRSTIGPDTEHGRFLMEDLVFATGKNIHIYIYKAIANFNINSKFRLFSLLILNLRLGILFI